MWREETQRGSGEICEGVAGTPAMIGVAIMIAVEEAGSDFPQIASPDRSTTQHTEGLLVGRSVTHQYEFHVAPPGAEPILRQDRRRNGQAAWLRGRNLRSSSRRTLNRSAHFLEQRAVRQV